MTFTSMGRITQPAPGTPVLLSANNTNRVAKIFFQIVPGATGKAYIGAPGMNKTTLAGVVRILVPGTATSIADQFTIETDAGNDLISLSDYAIDADIVNEGLLISYWTE